MNSMTPHEDEVLARALRGQVDGLTEAPLTVDDIAGKARRIRRNRRIAGVVGGVAVAAMALPAGLMSGSVLDRSDAPPVLTQGPSPTQAVEPTDTTEPSPLPASRPLDVSDLETGAPPALAYATVPADGSEGTLHTRDGREVQLPGSVSHFAPLDWTTLVQVWDATANEELLYLMADNGDLVEPWPLDGGFAVSAGGNVAAWTDPDGEVHVTMSSGEGGVRALATVPGAPFRTAGVLGEDCREGSTDCTVIVVSLARQARTYAVTAEGVAEVTSVRGATTGSDELVGGVVSTSDTGTCSRLLRDLTEQLWRTCDHRLTDFAPDGAHLIGLPAYADGLGPTELAILDATDGSPVQSWIGTRGSATYFDEVWEDDAHVLVVTYQRGEWAVVRLGLDGSMEYAIAPEPGEDLQRPILLEARQAAIG